MATVTKIVTIEVENDNNEDMAVARALDLFNAENGEGITLTWVDEYTA